MHSKRIALLIDCDNASHRTLEGVLTRLSEQGCITTIHAHGDWRSGNLAGWEKKIHTHGLHPIHSPCYVAGKNTTDIALTVDAMDLIYSGEIDAIALLASDSDYTPLVIRIKEKGIPVFGFGEMRTPAALVNACTHFINAEIGLYPFSSEKHKQHHRLNIKESIQNDPEISKTLTSAVLKHTFEHGWASLSVVGQTLIDEGFLWSRYGYKKVSRFLKETGLFDVTTINSTPCVRVLRKDLANTPETNLHIQ